MLLPVSLFSNAINNRSCVAGTLAGDEYRFGDVIAWFIVRLFVAIDIAYHRYNLILVCKTLKKR